MYWKLKLKNILEAGCTDSDIEDFVENHPEIKEKKIWDYVYEYLFQKGKTDESDKY